MRNSIISGLAALALAFGATSVTAQDAGLAERQALAEQLFDVTLGQELRDVFSAYVDRMIAADPDMQDDHAAWFRANLPSLMEELVQEASVRMAPMYAETMTTEELRYQLEFYESPMGRSIARKLLELGVRQEEVLADLTESFAVEMLSKFCTAFECDEAAGGRTAK